MTSSVAQDDTVRAFEAASFYAQALLPFGAAEVLPPAAFRSLAFHQMEDVAVWTREWVCVGTHHDIPAPGDLLPFTVGTHGLHVQRTPTGVVARFNKAQHGGCRAVPVQCQTGTKTPCSFTSCGYSRDRGPIAAGDLGDGAPEMHQYLGVRPERLLTARARSWGPLIFVCLDPAQTDLAARVSGLSTGFFGNGRGTGLGLRWIEAKANWKLLAQALLGDMASSCETAHCLAGDRRCAGSSLRAAWFFPNLLLLADENQTCAIVLQPTAVGQTMCRITVFGQERDDRDATAALWRERLTPALRQAEQDQDAAVTWATTSRPDTIGAPLPVQDRLQGAWMQRVLAQKVLSVSSTALDLQRFQSSGRY